MSRRAMCVAGALVVCAAMSLGSFSVIGAASDDEDKMIADSLAAMLQASRTVISRNQERINNPDIGDKGLDGKTVLDQSMKIYQEATKTDPLKVDSSSRHGRLLRAQMDAIVEVMDSNQKTINQPGVGFKAFIPAIFARLVNESFAKKAAGVAEVKVTAPIESATARLGPINGRPKSFAISCWHRTGRKGNCSRRSRAATGVPLSVSRCRSITPPPAFPVTADRRDRSTSPDIRKKAARRATSAESSASRSIAERERGRRKPETKFLCLPISA